LFFNFSKLKSVGQKVGIVLLFLFHAFFLLFYDVIQAFVRLSWSWWHGGWISNYLCNQCLSPLMLWVWTPLRQGVLDTLKFVSDLRQVCNFLRVLRFPIPVRHDHNGHYYRQVFFIQMWSIFVQFLYVPVHVFSFPFRVFCLCVVLCLVFHVVCVLFCVLCSILSVAINTLPFVVSWLHSTKIWWDSINIIL
jgi:hypothetical protein